MNPIVIKGIREIFKKSKEKDEKVIRHDFMQNSLLLYLTEIGYNGIKKYEIVYQSKYRSKKRFGKPRPDKNGRIDIYAQNKENAIAIEYDNAATIKWKSIEKLLQCRAGNCFGMISGTRRKKQELKEFYIKKNISRLQLVLEEIIPYLDINGKYEQLHQLLNKWFWLGICSCNYFRKFSPKEILDININLYIVPQFNKQRNNENKREKVKRKENSQKKHLIYILKLEDNKWYVGKTTNLMQRLKRHKKGLRTPWTKIHEIKEVHEVIENGDYKTITLDFMRKYGWKNVRGYAWSQWNLKKPPKVLRNEITS